MIACSRGDRSVFGGGTAAPSVKPCRGTPVFLNRELLASFLHQLSGHPQGVGVGVAIVGHCSHTAIK